MDPLTLLALIGGGLLLAGRHKAPAAIVAPALPAPALTSSIASPIAYQGQVPPPRGLEDVTASPIEQAGYIAPYQADPGMSAVSLDLGWRAPGTTLGGVGCGCSSCAHGLGDAASEATRRADRAALRAQLQAIRRAMHAAVAAGKAQGKTGAALVAIRQSFRSQIEAAIRAYQQAHPDEDIWNWPGWRRNQAVPSAAMQFLGPNGPQLPFAWSRHRLPSGAG